MEGIFSAEQTRVDSDLLETPTPSYGVLDVRVGGGRRNLRVTLAIENVLNTLYVDYLSYQRDPFRSGVRVREPGRNVYANLSFRF